MTALALAPTAEKALVDIQRAVLALRGCASALALPPVRPLCTGAAAPSPAELKALRGRRRAAFSFRGYGLRGGVLYAETTADEPPDSGGFSAAPEAIPRLGRLPGFYLADLEDCSRRAVGNQDLPALPAFTVRTLRLLVIEMAVSRADPWWRAAEWSVLSQDWIKLARD